MHNIFNVRNLMKELTGNNPAAQETTGVLSEEGTILEKRLAQVTSNSVLTEDSKKLADGVKNAEGEETVDPMDYFGQVKAVEPEPVVEPEPIEEMPLEELTPVAVPAEEVTEEPAQSPTEESAEEPIEPTPVEPTPIEESVVEEPVQESEEESTAQESEEESPAQEPEEESPAQEPEEKSPAQEPEEKSPQSDANELLKDLASLGNEKEKEVQPIVIDTKPEEPAKEQAKEPAEDEKISFVSEKPSYAAKKTVFQNSFMQLIDSCPEYKTTEAIVIDEIKDDKGAIAEKLNAFCSQYNIAVVPIGAVYSESFTKSISSIQGYTIYNMFGHKMAFKSSIRESIVSQTVDRIVDSLRKGLAYQEIISTTFKVDDNEYKILKLTINELSYIKARFRNYLVRFDFNENEARIIVGE